MVKELSPLLHPVDVRKADGGQAAYTLVKPGNRSDTALKHLLGAPPESRRLDKETDPAVSIAGFPLAADCVGTFIAHKISHNLAWGPELQQWLEALSPPLAQRVAVSIALQLHRDIATDPRPGLRLDPDDPVVLAACRIIHRPECLHALPTVDRILGSKIDGAGIMNPYQVAQLRSEGWRDAAERDIDSFLFAGATVATRATGKSSDRRFVNEPDRTRAEQIDCQLPATYFSVIDLLKNRGLILPERTRAWMREMAQGPQDNGDRPTNPGSSNGRRVSKEALDLDRINRLACGLPESFDASAPAPTAEPEAGDPPAPTL